MRGKLEETNYLEKEKVLLTVDLCDMSTTLHSDSDVDASKSLLTQQQHGLQELEEKTVMSM